VDSTASAISATDGWRLKVQRELAHRTIDLQRHLLQVSRDAHRPRAVAEVALDLAEDGGDGVAGERDLAVEVEAVDGLDQPERGDLHEVVERLLRALVTTGQLAGEREEALDEHLAVDGVAPVQVALEERPVLLSAVRRARRLVGRCLIGGQRGIHAARTRPVAEGWGLVRMLTTLSSSKRAPGRWGA